MAGRRAEEAKEMDLASGSTTPGAPAAATPRPGTRGASSTTAATTSSPRAQSSSRSSAPPVRSENNSTFDAFGNILGLAQIATTGTCPTTGSWSISASTNRFLSPDTYDAAGNETYNGLTTYTWDKWSQMATASGNGVNRSYLYTASGERVADRDNTIGGATTIAVRDLGGKVLRLFLENSTVLNGVLQHQATTWSEDFVWGNGMLLASVSADPDAGTRHYTRDHLGTPRLITGACGAIVARHDYYPFGLEATTSADGERMKFTGHERDAATGLDYMHARHHDFGVGRFISTDTGPHAQSKPQSWNRYAYALDNPMLHADPNGKVVPIIVAAVLVAALAADYANAPETASTTTYSNRDSYSRLIGGASLGASLGAAPTGVSASFAHNTLYGGAVAAVTSAPGLVKSDLPLPRKIEAFVSAFFVGTLTGLVPGGRPIQTVVANAFGGATADFMTQSQGAMTAPNAVAAGTEAGFSGLVTNLGGSPASQDLIGLASSLVLEIIRVYVVEPQLKNAADQCGLRMCQPEMTGKLIATAPGVDQGNVP